MVMAENGSVICHAGFMLSAIPSDKRIEIRSTIELLFTMKLEIATSTQPPSPPLCTAISEPEEERNNDTFDVAHLL